MIIWVEKKKKKILGVVGTLPLLLFYLYLRNLPKVFPSAEQPKASHLSEDAKVQNKEVKK